MVLQVLISVVAIAAFVCFILVAIPIFRQSVGLGILYVIVAIATCGIGALIWGWAKASEYGLQKVMVLWTICVVANLLLGAASIVAAGGEMREQFEGSTSRLEGQP